MFSTYRVFFFFDWFFDGSPVVSCFGSVSSGVDDFETGHLNVIVAVVERHRGLVIGAAGEFCDLLDFDFEIFVCSAVAFEHRGDAELI